MITPDLINCVFELGGGLVVLLNVKQILKDKQIKGVRLEPVAFFSIWGLWNLYFYPYLGQWASFIGGVGVTAANTLWLGLIIYYLLKNRNKK